MYQAKTLYMQMIEDGGFYPATLRDADNQILSNGEARLCISQSRGVFWPQEQPNEDFPIKKAAIVETLQGHRFAIRGVKLCCDRVLAGGPHYDFDLIIV